ncbi:acyl carrier protein [Streptomyces nogalater]|uniref:Acyl carrier protein n=1 Tax=Streptomyces nogalater TaxID=38314 RepID=A0ABW0WA73_STRNO
MHDEIRAFVSTALEAMTGEPVTIELTDDMPLGAGGLELESLFLLQLATQLEQEYGIAFPDDLGPLPRYTIGELATHVTAHITEPMEANHS